MNIRWKFHWKFCGQLLRQRSMKGRPNRNLTERIMKNFTIVTTSYWWCLGTPITVWRNWTAFHIIWKFWPIYCSDYRQQSTIIMLFGRSTATTSSRVSSRDCSLSVSPEFARQMRTSPHKNWSSSRRTSRPSRTCWRLIRWETRTCSTASREWRLIPTPLRLSRRKRKSFATKRAKWWKCSQSPKSKSLYHKSRSTRITPQWIWGPCVRGNMNTPKCPIWLRNTSRKKRPSKPSTPDSNKTSTKKMPRRKEMRDKATISSWPDSEQHTEARQL